jgi:hypothetical protein
MRWRIYDKDPTMFQDVRTLQVYRLGYAPEPHRPDPTGARLAGLVEEIVRRLNAPHPEPAAGDGQ